MATDSNARSDSALQGPDDVWLRDLDGTGSMHVCAEGDPGAVLYYPADDDREADAFLVEWRVQGEQWVDCHADEVRAHDQARKHGVRHIPLYRYPDPEIANLRRVLKGWSDWYRFATRDDENEYLNGKGWDDAEALAEMTNSALTRLNAATQSSEGL